MNSPLSSRIVRVVEYDPQWPEQFRRLRDGIWPSVSDVATALEHVGSTAVPGLAAKPVIDMDIVIPSPGELREFVIRLAALGYQHLGNLGIDDREAFRASGNPPDHNLYVCPGDSLALRNHLAFRDHLRSQPADVAAYSALKKQLAEQFPGDMDRYMDGKSDFILSILGRHGFPARSLDSIRRANRLKSGPLVIRSASSTQEPGLLHRPGQRESNRHVQPRTDSP